MEIDGILLEFGNTAQSISGIARGAFTVQKGMETVVFLDILLLFVSWHFNLIHRI
jgi:hypothetical protein